MRAERGLLLCLLLAGCAVNLESEPEPSPQAQPALPQLTGCLPLADRATTLTGRVSQLTLPDQSSLVLADSAALDAEASSVGFANAAGDCLTGSSALPARPFVDTSALAAGTRAHPLASVTLSDTFLYFSADHADSLASDGIGVARWSADSGRFVAVSLLWTADRPSYGSAAALVGDELYLLGGQNARYLAADVYLARVASSELSEPSAYEYWQGGGNFGPDADTAKPLLEGGQAPTLAWSAAQARWLMLYATPLAREVTVRSGLEVSGPWSAPYPLGRCDLPASDASSFCGELTLVPALASGGGIAFTQGVSSFARPASASDRDFWTRLIRVPWPSELP